MTARRKIDDDDVDVDGNRLDLIGLGNKEEKTNSTDLLFFIKGAVPGLSFFFFVFFKQLTISMFISKVGRWLDTKRGPLVMEETALPTEPQPLPADLLLYICLTLSTKSVKRVQEQKALRNPFSVGN